MSDFFVCRLDGTVSGCDRKSDNESLLYDNIDMSSRCEILSLQYETPQQGMVTNRTLTQAEIVTVINVVKSVSLLHNDVVSLSFFLKKHVTSIANLPSQVPRRLLK